MADKKSIIIAAAGVAVGVTMTEFAENQFIATALAQPQTVLGAVLLNKDNDCLDAVGASLVANPHIVSCIKKAVILDVAKGEETKWVCDAEGLERVDVDDLPKGKVSEVVPVP